MSDLEEESFKIAYCGVTIEITPLVYGADMRYVVKLPTREVIIELAIDEDTVCWHEVPDGKTELAEEIGSLIEESEM